MFSKKGQSALEYLMTYGWALVVIVIVIAALVFLIQPSQVGGNTCSTTSGILITNHQFDANKENQLGVQQPDANITFALSNQTASTLSTVNVTITGTVGGETVVNSTPPSITNLGTVSQTAEFDIHQGITATAGEQYSINVNFQYSDRDGFARTVTSTCNGTTS